MLQGDGSGCETLTNLLMSNVSNLPFGVSFAAIELASPNASPPEVGSAGRISSEILEVEKDGRAVPMCKARDFRIQTVGDVGDFDAFASHLFPIAVHHLLGLWELWGREMRH